MAEDVTIPKVGSVPKKVLFPIGAVAASYVGWRYYRSRSEVGDASEVGDTAFEDPGVLPPVSGAVPGDNSYGSGSAEPSTGDFGFTGHSNDEWSQYVTAQLSSSDVWSYTDIVTALGAHLQHKPLTSLQQQIVSAAYAVAGPPPVGTFPIVSGGDTPITVAPTGVRGVATATQITVSFNAVAGASHYNVYRSNVTGSTGVPHGSGSTSPIQLTGLEPNKSYTIQVAAVSASGAVGPKSSAITVKTAGTTLAKPRKPAVTNITSSTAVASTGAVTFANGYDWYVNEILRAHTNTPTWTATKMTSKRRYRFRVRATISTGSPSPLSDSTYITTK